MCVCMYVCTYVCTYILGLPLQPYRTQGLKKMRTQFWLQQHMAATLDFWRAFYRLV